MLSRNEDISPFSLFFQDPRLEKEYRFHYSQLFGSQIYGRYGYLSAAFSTSLVALLLRTARALENFTVRDLPGSKEETYLGFLSLLFHVICLWKIQSRTQGPRPKTLESGDLLAVLWYVYLSSVLGIY